MCGIAGMARFDGAPADLDAVIAMSAALAHRGPDGDGIYAAEGVALAHRRLAIIDPSGGRQPFIDDAAGLALTYNGEVYNYGEIRRELGGEGFRTDSDTEVVLRAYARWGIGCLAKFRGMFAFALHDRRAGKLYLVRDRLGIKPLHYRLDERALVFASELSALAGSGTVPAEIDRVALAAYLRFGYVPTPATIWTGMRKLEPGCYLEVDVASGRATTHRYWQLAPNIRERSEAAASEELDALLDEIIRLYVRSDVPFGAFLSGGVDSSLVAALMARVLDSPVRSFTIGFAEDDYSELPYADEAARAIGARHTGTALSPEMSKTLLDRIAARFGEPFADSSSIPTWLVSSLAARDVKMVLSGDGGDELFAGYNSYPAVFDATNPRPQTAWNRGRTWLESLGSASVNESWERVHHRQRDTFSAADRIRLMGGAAPDVARDDELTQPADLDAVSRCQYRDVHTYLLDDILTKVDRMSMDSSLEVRVPLLDHKLVEFAFNLPTALKIARDGQGAVVTKRLLKRSAARFYPRSLIERRKWGFGIPVHRWTQGALKGLILDLLDAGAARFEPHLDAAAVRGVVREYYAGRGERIGEVWNLLALRLWLDACGAGAAREAVPASLAASQ
jgi:asparagine synthase (glutamine-hydrolysing)